MCNVRIHLHAKTHISSHPMVAASIAKILSVLAVLAVAGITAASAQVMSLTMASDPGDYIGGTQFYFYTPSMGTFSGQASYSQQVVSISYMASDYSHWWYLNFAAPSGQILTPGTYTGAARYPFQTPDQPGLSVYGDGRGCNTLTGSFQVVQADFDGSGDLTAFDASFVQHCEGDATALRGEIRYNATAVVNLSAPTMLNVIKGQHVSFGIAATDAMSRTVSLSATEIPAGATFQDNGDNSGTFDWTPNASQVGPCLISFAGTDDLGNASAAYTYVTVIALPSSLDIYLPSGGAAVASTVGSNGATQAGYATLTVSYGADPYGIAVLSFRQNGITVTEAGVPASPPTTLARVFIDYRSAVLGLPGQSNSGLIDINTGIAVVNTGNADASVTYILRDIAGTTLATANGTIAAGAHFAKFINQLADVAPDFNLPSNFKNSIQFATLEIASDLPLSILALRATNNQRNDFLITTTPIADLTQIVSSASVYFPQFVDGGGYTTSLVLLNTSNAQERGRLQILDNNGSPIVVHQVGGTTDSSFRYSIPAGGAFRFQTDGSSASVSVGWARLIPDFYSPTPPVGSGVFSYYPGNILISESGIPAAVSTNHARIHVDLSGNHNTGLAIANVGGTAASIAINAFQNDGSTPAGTSQGPLQLATHGHAAKFADQLIDGLPVGFTGVLDISSTTPFAALTMRSLVNERDDFLMTTFPIADANAAAPWPIIFPQIADGGGYRTQFIFLSPNESSSSTLGFHAEDGTPLEIGEYIVDAVGP